MPETIKILIADDHALVRKGLVALLDDHHDLTIVGEASNGIEAFKLVESLNPDVILMDLEMPLQDGITTIKKIIHAKMACKILVLTSFSNENRVISAIRAGADGYLLKTTMPSDLIRSIFDVQEGRIPLDPAITSTVLKELNQRDDHPQSNVSELSDREMMVLELITEGNSNRQIALELNISERTVSTHVSHILEKLKVENRTQAALYALRTGLISMDIEQEL